MNQINQIQSLVIETANYLELHLLVFLGCSICMVWAVANLFIGPLFKTKEL